MKPLTQRASAALCGLAIVFGAGTLFSTPAHAATAQADIAIYADANFTRDSVGLIMANGDSVNLHDVWAGGAMYGDRVSSMKVPARTVAVTNDWQGGVRVYGAGDYSWMGADNDTFDEIRAYVYDTDAEYQLGLKQMQATYGTWGFNAQVTDVSTSTKVTGEPEVTLKDKRVQTAGSIYDSSAVLVNDTDRTQTMSSQAFSLWSNTTVTTSSSVGGSLGVNMSSELKLFELVGINVGVNFSVNWNDTTTRSTMEQSQQQVPSQTITVPAHHAVKVTARLDRNRITGTLVAKGGLTSERNGLVKLGGRSYPWSVAVPTGSAERQLTVDYGDSLHVYVEDVTTGETADLGSYDAGDEVPSTAVTMGDSSI